MHKLLYPTLVLVLVGLFSLPANAGNPDRQGEAGAYELLMNPWARTAGLHTMTTAGVAGVEAMRLNIAGLVRIDKTQFEAGHAIYLEGTGLSLNSFGFAQKLGENTAIGVSLMSVSFGDIPVTTTAQPEGTGATFSPSFFNLGLGFSHIFENKVTVGVLVRSVNEAIADLSANSFAIDAGVQYVTGENDNFKLGISLRNIGAPMRFDGQGLSFPAKIPEGSVSYNLTSNYRAADFELQSLLNIGLSYDFLFGEQYRLTALGNFTSNAFARDQIGAGVEFAMGTRLMLRAGYKYELGSAGAPPEEAPVYSGLALGASLGFDARDVDGAVKSHFAIDYAYRPTRSFGGTHNISVRLDLH